MPPLNIEERTPTPSPNGFALFALGFRPFFLAAGIAAVALLAGWLHSYSSGTPLSNYYGFVGWHSHEMLFGYVLAVVAGFLLTAVRNWTGIDTPSGTPLMLLFLLWAAGRITPLFSELIPAPLIALIDLAFVPALGVAAGTPLVRAKQKNNAIFLLIIALLTIANLMIHLEALDIAPTGKSGINLAVGMIVLLVAVLGGRVIPFFTERGLGNVKTHSWPWVEKSAIGTLLLLVVTEQLLPDTVAVALVAIFATLIHAFRLYGWLPLRTARTPLLWVLHIAYLWIVIGLLFKALVIFDMIPSVLALHALTVGGIGMMTLGMMARVAIGHTGREMVIGHSIAFAFALVGIAAVIRVLLPLSMMDQYPLLITLSGVAWITAFSILVVVYLPILIRPRIDGRPG